MTAILRHILAFLVNACRTVPDARRKVQLVSAFTNSFASLGNWTDVSISLNCVLLAWIDIKYSKTNRNGVIFVI